MKKELVIVLDFGGQYNQLIARRVRDHHVYCEIMSYRTPISVIREKNPKGIIFTGGPNSVNDCKSPMYDSAIFELGIPILGICYGCQLISKLLGGRVEKPQKREYGKANVSVTGSLLFSNIPENTVCWMSHTDQVTVVPDGFHVTAFTDTCPNAAIENKEKQIYGVQFHPEVQHTAYGNQMLGNFLFKVCGCIGDWKMDQFAHETILSLKEKIGDKKVLCGLSGGVDSSVAAALIHKAVGKQLTCIFVDHGLLRKNEGDQVIDVFTKQFDMNIIRVNVQDQFFDKLAGVADPEKKRKIIGEEFIRVFEAEAKKIGVVDYLVQGTIYPDVVESGSGGESTTIKSHHNVGGLPEHALP